MNALCRRKDIAHKLQDRSPVHKHLLFVDGFNVFYHSYAMLDVPRVSSFFELHRESSLKSRNIV